MSIHINAKQGEVAETVLLPGDPLRAKYIAENFFEDAHCYSEVRGMLGFTGLYKGERVSVQATGMGMPSASIYLTELMKDYGAKQLLRIGTCGAIREDIHLRDVLVAQSACTDSAMYRGLTPGIAFAPVGDFDMIRRAWDYGVTHDIPVRVGNILTSDTFYHDDPSVETDLNRLGVMAVEMETAALYMLAAKFHTQAVSILTVSDHILTGEQTTAMERQTSFQQMVEVALAATGI